MQLASMNVLTTVVMVIALAELLLAKSLEVETGQGRISGIEEKSTHGKTFYSYYGIPFAMPPVGKLRFKVSLYPKLKFYYLCQ